MRAPSFLARYATLLALVVATTGAAETEHQQVREWLDRMATAVETLNYRGVLVHWQEDRVESLRIIHRADENSFRERIYSLDGDPREILRDGDSIRCLLAGDQPLLMQSQLTSRLMPNLPINLIGQAESAYRMSMGDKERVAGKMTQVIEISPLDPYRYGYRLWLEEDTGMLLRSALMDEDGRALQQVSFASIELGVAISDSELEPELDPELMTELPVADEIPDSWPIDPDNASWLPPRVPPGFELVKVGTGETQNGDGFEHLVFSDGLASFSIYVEERKSANRRGRIKSVGPVHVYSGGLDNHQITIVGEVPLTTVQYIGLGLGRTAELHQKQ
jgi:sigma-E factor negative regulatory protein RseB